MIPVWSRKQLQRVCAHGGATGRRASQWTTDFSRNSGTYNSHVTCSNFLFFVNHGYAHITLLCFSLVMLSASHWLLAQARFCGRTHLPLSPNSMTPTIQVIFPISSTGWTCFQHNNCGHGDISAITLLILSLSGYNPVNILWYTAPVDMMTFRWSHRSYQSICQQHPLYSHPQVTLMYYRCNIILVFELTLFEAVVQDLSRYATRTSP